MWYLHCKWSVLILGDANAGDVWILNHVRLALIKEALAVDSTGPLSLAASKLCGTCTRTSAPFAQSCCFVQQVVVKVVCFRGHAAGRGWCGIVAAPDQEH